MTNKYADQIVALMESELARLYCYVPNNEHFKTTNHKACKMRLSLRDYDNFTSAGETRK